MFFLLGYILIDKEVMSSYFLKIIFFLINLMNLLLTSPHFLTYL